MKRTFAVISRQGFFRDYTNVQSAHATKDAAVRVANRERVSLPGGEPNQSCAMVVYNADGFAKGERVYGDTIGDSISVIW